MSKPKLISVITTTQAPTTSVRALLARLQPLGAPLLIIGDKKGPFAYDAPGAELFTLEAQQKLPFQLAPLLPTGHYVRKNLGYLLAIRRGAQCIYETDDDNAPLDFWQPRSLTAAARVFGGQGWVNIYRAFTDEVIWPRGFPLDCSRQGLAAADLATALTPAESPIQQGLANIAPDVDAVWRLMMGHEVSFRAGEGIRLPRGAWCPFNSQSTWWWPAAYPLMYLPSGCSFRMTDIWRSFVAQRCLWETGAGVTFHGAEVAQDRNVHNLMKDFADEVSGYLRNREIADWLMALPLKPGAENAGANLLACYEMLVARGVFPPSELPLVQAWLNDLKAV